MSEVKTRVEIRVTRTFPERAVVATIITDRKKQAMNPCCLADKLGRKALKLLDKAYGRVTIDEQTEG